MVTAEVFVDCIMFLKEKGSALSNTVVSLATRCALVVLKNFITSEKEGDFKLEALLNKLKISNF